MKRKFVILLGIMLLCSLFFTGCQSSAEKCIEAIENRDYDTAMELKEAHSDDEEFVAQVNAYLDSVLEPIYTDYNNGKITYEQAKDKTANFYKLYMGDVQYNISALKVSKDSFEAATDFENEGDLSSAYQEYLCVIAADTNYKTAQKKAAELKNKIQENAVAQLEYYMQANDFQSGLDYIENLPNFLKNDSDVSSYKSIFEEKKKNYEALEAERARQQEIADYKNSCKNISYNELAREPDVYEGQDIHIHGRVVQVLEDGDSLNLRVATKNSGYGYYDDIVLVGYKYKDGESKILEDDMIDLYGSYLGTTSYKSVMGQTITIPAMNASYKD